MTGAPGVRTDLRVTVELIHHLDALGWTERHRRGEVPDATPYGIGLLAEHGMDVRFRAPVHGRWGEAVTRRLRERTGAVEYAEAALSLRGRRLHHADVVLCWDEFTGVPAALASRLPGSAPVVTGVHLLSDPLARSRAFLAAARAGLHRAAAVFVQAESMVPVMAERYGLPEDGVSVVRFGVDEGFFRPLGHEVDRDRVVSVGDDRHRDHPTLVAAVERTRSRRPATRLSLATTLPVRLDPASGVVHSRHLGSSRPVFYGTAAVVAVATTPNVHGSGLSVLLEAMACGRPYVCTASPGLTDYVQHGVTGLVVEPGDVAAFSEALLQLLEDPDLADRLGRAGRRAVEERFTTAEQARQVAALLRTAVGR